jgi:hypothetical protein
VAMTELVLGVNDHGPHLLGLIIQLGTNLKLFFHESTAAHEVIKSNGKKSMSYTTQAKHISTNTQHFISEASFRQTFGMDGNSIVSLIH